MLISRTCTGLGRVQRWFPGGARQKEKQIRAHYHMGADLGAFIGNEPRHVRGRRPRHLASRRRTATGSLPRFWQTPTFRSLEEEFAGRRETNPFAFVHDAWIEQRIWNDHLNIGCGLHSWWGISRMTNTSTLNLMTLDSPIFTWPLFQRSDQFARQLGIYAKGQVGRLD